MNLNFCCIFVFLLLSLVTFGNTTEYEVIVIGAGLSGLAAGKYFQDNNITNFLILEANDYLGGRVKNVMFEGNSLALGAGWLHNVGENHIIFQKAVKYGLAYYNDSYEFTNIMVKNTKDGSTIPTAEVSKASVKLLASIEKMDELVEARINKGRGSIDLKSGLRWGGFVADTPLKRALNFWYFNFENGIETNAMDGLAYGSTSSGAHEERIVTDPRGFSYPVVHEAESYKKQTKLNKTVTSVTQGADKKYNISCSDGTSYKAKYVLVTVSTGVLQANSIKFTPSLPAWKIEALNMVPMCHYCKIFLKFPTVFWDNSKGYFVLATETEDNYVHWQNFNKDGLFPGSRVLLVTLTGKICAESYFFTDTGIIDQAYAVLKKAFVNATKPTDIVRNDFSTNPNFLGSYSFQVPGINEDDYRALEHPVRQSLYFAGEAYKRWEFGYAHGAYMNGWEAAKNITKCMKNADDCLPDSPNFVMKKTCPSSANMLKMENWLYLLIVFSLSILNNMY